MDQDATTRTVEPGGSRLVALAVLSIVAAVGLGWGVIKVVDAVEAGGGCGSYGYGGYGCEPPGDFSITVAPSTDLVDRQTVTLTGTGFLPNTFFGAAQCDPSVGPDAGTAACDLSTARTTYTDGAGNVQLDVPVRRVILVQGNEVDCALSPCTIGAATLSDSTTPIQATSFPISFDPSVPAVPRLQIELTVDEVTVSAVSGTVTCNREAEVFANAYVQQQKGSHQASAYGYSEQPVVCATTPTAWTTPLVDGTGRLSGGPATYDVYGSAYDGFESASAEVTGTTKLAGGRPPIMPGAQPGETVRVEILGTTRTASGLAVDLTVTCDRAVPDAYSYVEVSQWAGLNKVSGFGSTSFGPCDGTRRVSVPITDLSGVLAGGPAEVRAYVDVFDDQPPGSEFYDSASAAGAVRLRGAQRPAPVTAEPNPGSRITITGVTASQLTGTVTCEEPAQVELWTQVQQPKGRTTNDAYGFGMVACDGTTPFTIPFEEGRLSGGSASAFVYASAYQLVGEEYQYLWDDHQAGELRIGR